MPDPEALVPAICIGDAFGDHDWLPTIEGEFIKSLRCGWCGLVVGVSVALDD